MAFMRVNHSAVLLQNGKVLVAGGAALMAGGGGTGSVELYDPTAGTWSSAGTLSSAVPRGTATLLANGQVLVAGGNGLNIAELYDPVTNSWSITGSLLAERFGHTATLLSNGTVLVAGGSTDQPGGVRADNVATAELYDPVVGTWSSTGSLNVGRGGHSATLLPNGVVLVAGGQGSVVDAPLTSSELYY
jgi:N-acetylneuraminic acid mutarotase